MSSALLRQSRNALNTIRRVHPFLRHVSLTTLSLILFWIYAVQHNERSVFSSRISDCDWTSWEAWPVDARPHRAVMIADPQLVDAHTYPGRPWPLSTLTEKYTDRYMARSFRMLNSQLDPDSIVFLGDMFDGGREWAPATTRPLTSVQQWSMEARSPNTKEVPQEYNIMEVTDPGWETGMQEPGEKRSDEDAVSVAKKEHGDDLKTFMHGEGGLWAAYGNKYWEKEYKRFGKIFLSPEQLYPQSHRQLEVVDLVKQDAVNIENGAPDKARYHYGVVAGKTRSVLSSLPGNHDLGFGSGVQLPIRARYKWHFGEMNRVDVLGNHTFVSIDALSLAAWSQFEPTGQESSKTEASGRKYIYTPAQNFLDNITSIAEAQIRLELKTLHAERYPKTPQWQQSVADPTEQNLLAPQIELAVENPYHLPVVLLTHVPLYRAPDTPCGSQRERGHALSITGGYQYQNVLTRTLSNTIAQKLSKIGTLRQIFSGDDHDYCDVTHNFDRSVKPTISAREETVKSFSWAMGVRHPGFMMVSLWNPIDENGKPTLNTEGTIQTHMCLLPDQLGLFLQYAWFAGITLIVLLTRAITLSLRKKADPEELSPSSSSIQLSKLIPSGFVKLKGLANGYQPVSKGRHRASSSALKPPSNGNLSVQRSPNARARSVSPGYGSPYFQASSARSDQPSPSKPGPLIDQAGYYPHLRYDSSNHASDDEESRIGDADYLDEDDTQAKWRNRRRPRSQVRRAWDDFSGSLLLVAGIAGCYYMRLTWSG